jgi:hypothetical protein
MQFMVSSSPRAVSAWSRARLPFQPLGWQRQLRDELRAALRLLSATAGGGLIAEYHAPDRAFVDLENVLLYNVGMSAFAPLITAGLTCRRGIATDGLHHVRYQVTDEPPEPGRGVPLGMASADLGQRLPASVGHWWTALRAGATATANPGRTADMFTIDVTIAGPHASGARLANLIKPMLDGLVSCFHAHDGSHADHIRPNLATLGPVEAVWHQLLDQSTALLGVRPLIRPYRHAIAWNPADERCQAFRIRAHRAAHWSIHAAVAVANGPSMPTGPSDARPADS